MLRNHLKVAFRHLRRRRGYTLLNTGGLAVGLATCLLIALWVRHETSYDDFHENAERLYRVGLNVTNANGRIDRTANTQAVLGHALHAQGAPAVERAIRFWPQTGLFRSGPNRQFYESTDAFFLADSTALTAFTFPLRHGNRQTALDAPNSIVLSPAAAARYFPDDENPVGRTLRRSQGDAFTVTGVLKRIPTTSQLRPDLLVSMSTEEKDDGPRGMWRNWSALSPLTYVLLRKGATHEAAQAQLNRLLKARAGDLQNRLDLSMRYALEPLTSVHLRSGYGGPGAAGSLTNVRLFSLVALFILSLACVNYTNLATAQSRRRAKEVGVRRTVGAGRGGVAAQLVIEAVLLALAAGLAALGLARVLLPAFAQLAGVEHLRFADGPALGLFAIAVLGTGLMAGAYPAFVLSGFRPAEVLRGGGGPRGRAAQGVRRGLTAFQFAVAIGLIAATAVVFSQLRHMQDQELGFWKDRMLVLNFGGDEDVQERLAAVKRRFEKLPAVERATASVDYPGDDGHNSAGGTLEHADGREQRADVQLYRVDSSYTSVYDITLVAGQPMARAALPDSLRPYLLNETAAREHGYASPEQAVGQRAQFWGQPGRVVGVVKDFHAGGLQEAIAPIALVEWPESTSNLTLRLHKGSNVKQALSQVKAAWHEIAPERPFDYQFLDQAFDAQYRTERRFGRLFGVGAALAIFVACLGLFGLAAFAVEERAKEIGIRKALGASAGSIVTLLSKDFLKLVLVGFAVAAPVAWWAMQRWLEGFAYRIELGPLVFAGAGAVALLVAALTTGTQALRAARANPADALRDE